MTSNVHSFSKPFEYKIHVPEIRGQYNFVEGAQLAAKHLTPDLIKDFSDNKVTIALLFPDGLNQYEAGKPAKLLGEFFAGLLGDVVKDFRDAHFSDTKHKVKRHQLADVKQEPDVEKIFQQTLGSVWSVCAPIEDELAKRIKIGVILGNGHTNYDEETQPFLAHAANKYSKALDALFMTDFKIVKEAQLNL